MWSIYKFITLTSWNDSVSWPLDQTRLNCPTLTFIETSQPIYRAGVHATARMGLFPYSALRRLDLVAPPPALALNSWALQAGGEGCLSCTPWQEVWGACLARRGQMAQVGVSRVRHQPWWSCDCLKNKITMSSLNTCESQSTSRATHCSHSVPYRTNRPINSIKTKPNFPHMYWYIYFLLN